MHRHARLPIFYSAWGNLTDTYSTFKAAYVFAHRLNVTVVVPTPSPSPSPSATPSPSPPHSVAEPDALASATPGAGDGDAHAKPEPHCGAGTADTDAGGGVELDERHAGRGDDGRRDGPTSTVVVKSNCKDWKHSFNPNKERKGLLDTLNNGRSDRTSLTTR
eukprot:tig00001066_g6749.t1